MGVCSFSSGSYPDCRRFYKDNKQSTMTITFNPDPKLQAEAMIKQFKPLVDASVLTPVPGGHFSVRHNDAYWLSNAKSCALIAAEMCLSMTIGKLDNHFGRQYWSAVIEELEKL